MFNPENNDTGGCSHIHMNGSKHEDHHDHNHDDKHGGHDHNHGHSHGVYKHIGHPNGPRTMIDQGVCCCFMGQFPDHIVLEQRAILALADTNK